MKPPKNTSNVLKAQAKVLTDKIFRYLPCVVCLSRGKRRTNTEKHHLIHKSQSTRYKFNIWNILPISDKEHRTGKEAAHEDRDKFLAWVKNNLPLHWAWYQKHKDESPHTLYTADWAEICADLRYYVEHPEKAEQIIYEK